MPEAVTRPGPGPHNLKLFFAGGETCCRGHEADRAPVFIEEQSRP